MSSIMRITHSAKSTQ